MQRPSLAMRTWWVRQGSVIAPAIGMDWLLERSVRREMNGITFRQYAFTDLDFAYDMSFLAELLELLVPALEIPGGSCTTQSRSNLAKTVLQALGALSRMSPQVFASVASVGTMSNVRNHLSIYELWFTHPVAVIPRYAGAVPWHDQQCRVLTDTCGGHG